MSDEMTRRSLIQMGIAGAGLAVLPSAVSACASSAKSSTSVAPTTSNPENALLEAARKERKLNLISISDSADSPYIEVLDTFRKATGIKITLLLPPATSTMEIEQVQSKKGKPTQPDIIDVGQSAALQAVKDGLLVSYLPEQWTDIPNAAKDANGYWSASYYALMGIVSTPSLLGSNKPPATFQDLLDLKDGVKVGFPGDPRTTKDAGPMASASAFGSVWSAALALGGSLDDISPGVEFFKELKAKGTFVPNLWGFVGTVASGSIPITMMTISDFLQARDQLQKKTGVNLKCSIDATKSLFPNYFAQGAVKGSPHPNAAKLWLNHLISDQGAKAFLKGAMVPTRFPSMVQQGTVSASDLGAFKDFGIPVDDLVKALSTTVLPTVAQINTAQEYVNTHWGPDVLGTQS